MTFMNKSWAEQVSSVLSTLNYTIDFMFLALHIHPRVFISSEWRLHLTTCFILETKPDRHSLQFLSICFIVLFLPSPVRWQRPRVNKKFATLPPSPTRLSPSKRNTHLTANRLPHFGGPHRFTLTPLKTKYSFSTGGMAGASRRGASPRLPRWTRGVSAQDPHAPQTSTQTRDWHHEGKSLKFVSVLGGGEEREKNKHFSFLGFRALTCWSGPQVLLSASQHQSQRLEEKKKKRTLSHPIHSGTRA